MASTEEEEKKAVELVETTTTIEKVASPPPSPAKDVEAPPPAVAAKTGGGCVKVEVGVRVLLFVTTLTSLLLMVTSKESKLVLTPLAPFPIPLQAKFQHSPAFIYFVVALTFASFYSLITALVSIFTILKPNYALKFLLFFLLTDVVILGVVASATGTAGGVAYIGLKGNNHAQWGKVCPTFGKYCRHLGASIVVSLLSAFLFIFLIFISLFSLHKKLPK